MSIDVEDWFHLLKLESTPDIPRWATLDSRGERTFLKLLEEFDEAGVKVICFFLGWVAEHFRNWCGRLTLLRVREEKNSFALMHNSSMQIVIAACYVASACRAGCL